MPKISVVIPTFNRAAYLDGAIESVLAQTGADFELIVSDNCSQDETQAVVSKYLSDSRVRYFRNEQNIGMVRNWRKAVYECATGEWFLLLSDDDYLIDPGYLAKVSRMIANDPSLVLVYAEGYLLDESTGQRTLLELPFEGRVTGTEVFLSRGTVKPQDFTLCNIVFDRNMTMELNAFSNPNNIACDSELFLKLTLMGDVGVIKKPVSVYRFHSGNLLATMSRSVDLAYGNIDFMLSPYLLAKERLTPDQVATFRKNSDMDSQIQNSLVLVAAYNWKLFHQAREEIVNKAPELAGALASPGFQIRLLMYRLGGWAYPAMLKFRAGYRKVLNIIRPSGRG